MTYSNPVILSDYAEPDVIRVGNDFYLVASSTNHTPVIPVLHSKNLVEWRLINYVADELPFSRFNGVRHGGGAHSPSIRYHGGKFYCLVSFPDEGIFVSETENIRGKWSPFRPLVEGAGMKDACPIWSNGRCYIVFAFEKGHAEFNSRLAVFEANENLTAASEKYTIIYDGRNNSPEICCPKIYRHGKFFYILAPAGGPSGWQVALRSPDVYGPFESKIILRQGDTEINGPHGGALVDIDDGGEKWAYVHVQDMGGYGSALHVQPAIWLDEWIICGNNGVPVSGGEYPVDVKTDYAISASDEFDGEKLSIIWQNPANRGENWFEMKHGLKLACAYYGGNSLADLPQMFLQKAPHLNFSVKTKCKLNLVNDGDEVGFVIFGKEYAYICVVRQGGQNYLEIRKGSQNGGEDETLCRSQPYDENYVTFQTSAKYEDRNKLTFKFTFGGSAFTHKFYASKSEGSGAKMGIYARANDVSKGSATFKFFRVVCTDKRILKNG